MGWLLGIALVEGVSLLTLAACFYCAEPTDADLDG